jgi:dipeptidyl aminopeptidase/acylaminoacyl peptidase
LPAAQVRGLALEAKVKLGNIQKKKNFMKRDRPFILAIAYHVRSFFFQGLEDKVVPPNQAEMMFAAIKEKELPVAYVTFEDEGHGFRQADNIKKVPMTLSQSRFLI